MLWKTLPILSAVLLLPPLLVDAAPNPKVPPIKVIAKATPGRGIFNIATRNKPLVIRSEKEAAKHFEGDELARLTKQVDFEQQIVLVFAWRGSGQDKLTYSVLESYPEQVVFHYKPGRTKDLRPHIHVYALRSNVKWRTGAGGGSTPGPKVKDYVRVEVGGTLNSEVVAIGGETTGYTITANGITWELNFKTRYEMRMAQQLHGKRVVVSGELTRKKGVEIKERWIVDVTSLKAAESSDSPGKP